MALEVTIHKATNLANLEKIGKSDPYVILLFQGLKQKTNYISGNLNPEWNESFTWEIGKKAPAPDESLVLWVKDYEHVGRNRLMGEATLLLRNALESEQPVEYELKLFDHNQRETTSTLFLTVTYRKPVTGTETENIPLSTQNISASAFKQNTDNSNLSLMRNDMTVDPALAANKTKFQVRVYVLEARQLVGSNLNPICQVIVSHVSKQTQIVKGTSNPWWKEIFFFNMECTALELYKEALEFKVRNSKALRSAMLIGHFKMDLGQVYGQPRHAYINKWLLLKNDDDDNISEVVGYLKASVAIIGPGDDIPEFDVANDNEDDVESNLLLPLGTQLKPATFILDLYQAADLPRMDPGTMEGVKRILNIDKKKDLIDPYVIVSFAGNQVSSKIIYGDDHPSWNEKMFIGFQFPSVCDKIKLTLKDWDRVSDDDTIAMVEIPIPLISASGDNGFLPCFGPTWVNFYGGPREFSLLDNGKKTKNTEDTEACCFRGRVLLSLTTDLGSYPNAKSLALGSDDVIRSQFFCRRRRFRLHATFLDATMVNIIDAPIEFEVSIGNFGNKFEDRFLPSPSSTQPTNAVFDGCRYYYLPWKDNKPSVVVISQWEDVTFRLETINMFLRAAYLMEQELNQCSVIEADEEGTMMSTLINTFHELINFDLPVAKSGTQQENELDRLLRRRRTEEMKNLRDQLTSLLLQNEVTPEEILQQLRDVLREFKHLICEPQNSIPDIIIWMLSGKKRIGFQRIPAHEVLFSMFQERCGQKCDKILTLTLKKSKNGNTSDSELSAVVRARFWFGLEAQETHWRQIAQSNAALTVFAETYENQVNLLGNWTNKGPTMTRPSWSDASGTVKLKPDTIIPPPGWRFKEDWFIAPEPSLQYNEDAGRKSFLEDVFENQTRLPGTSWNATNPSWTDLRGDSVTPRDEVEPPSGWEWEDVWQVDLHRAVDEEGWEYTVEATLGGYQPVEKTYHLCRRRRWVRMRKLESDAAAAIEEREAVDDTMQEDGGWEYSMLFGSKFHNKRKKMDLVRRRRWHRVLESDDPVAPLVFNIHPTQTNEQDVVKASISCPRLSVTYSECYRMQFRAYIYQARELSAGDKTGFSDPYVCISFLHQSQMTEVVSKTLNPTWDQTLIFQEVPVYGTQQEIKQQPPLAVLEMYDRDTHGDDEFLGRVFLEPVVQEDCQEFQSPPLTWHSLMQGHTKKGEVLVSCELFFVDDDSSPLEPPKRGNIYIVPSQIRPKLQLSAVEILCWGMRNMKTFELCPVSRPSIEFDCGGTTVQSKPIKDMKNNPNFDDPVLYLEMLLPQESRFMPPMSIRVRDHRQFGRKPVVGTHTITRLDPYIHAIPLDVMMNGQLPQMSIDAPDGEDTIIDIDDESNKDNLENIDSSIDWWAKYYASTGDMSKAGQYLQLGYDTLKVFPMELEKMEPYNGFSDFLNTFHLNRGKSKSLEETSSVGEFKGTFRIFPIPSDPDEPRPPRLLKSLPHNTKEEVLVRVYVVRAYDLVPKDSNGKADPFVRVKLGKKEVDNRKNYVPNTLSPIFGEVFELSGTIPLNKDLTVSLWDYDLVSSDDLIGETVVDLENRYLTKYRATCGLPLSYEICGLNKWRDCKKPTEILEDVCTLRHLPSPVFHSTSVASIGNRRYALDDFEYDLKDNPRMGPAKQRLALHILHEMKAVPEHVETRSLFNPASPDLQQGKIQLWVDIFPTSQGKPGPLVNISPRVPERYVLRVIIWNTYEVPLDEKNVVSGDTMSDIYVKAIFADGHSQKTDVHYRSMDGEGNFNWRMIFPIDYLIAENKVTLKKKKHLWSLDKTETLVPPKITFQIWDDDIFSSDDFLGALEFPLNAIPTPTKSVEKCHLEQLGLEEGEPLKLSLQLPPEKMMNLFKKKRTRGFWPCYSFKSDIGYSIAGKLEMEMELLTAEEAESKPAGLGRDEPNLNPTLEQPKRPETSFLWFTSPWKSFKFVLWRKYKWYCITLLLIFLAVLLVVLFIYSFPESLAFRLVN